MTIAGYQQVFVQNYNISWTLIMGLKENRTLKNDEGIILFSIHEIRNCNYGKILIFCF